MKPYHSKRRWIAVGVVLGIVWLFLPISFPLDVTGRLPQQVARQFVEAVRARDYSSARATWTPDSIANIERNYGLSFSDVCERLFQCDRYSVRLAATGKGGTYVVGFEGDGSAGKKTYSIYLARTDGRWRIVENLIRRTSPPQ